LQQQQQLYISLMLVSRIINIFSSSTICSSSSYIFLMLVSRIINIIINNISSNSSNSSSSSSSSLYILYVSQSPAGGVAELFGSCWRAWHGRLGTGGYGHEGPRHVRLPHTLLCRLALFPLHYTFACLLHVP